MNPMPRHIARFRWVALVTLVAVYLLIVVGASVRATGAGMGCPDWPKCFGMWIPPTDVSQLPADYQDIYAHRGYADTEFNAVKTWTEYLNRLMGATVGLLVMAMALVAALSLWRSDRTVLVWSFAAVLLTGFAGWLGKVVVENNLNPVTITLHMATALLIVLSIIAAFARAGRDYYPAVNGGDLRWLRIATAVCIGLSLIQIFMGTQVRQEVDAIADLMGNERRGDWASALPILFYVHRSFSILILLANSALVYGVYRRARGCTPALRSANGVIAIILVEIATGALLYYASFPAFLQPAHLICAALLFGAQTHVWLALRYAARNGAAPAAVQ